jgi:hypothetical protein
MPAGERSAMEGRFCAEGWCDHERIHLEGELVYGKLVFLQIHMVRRVSNIESAPGGGIWHAEMERWRYALF